MERVAIFAGSFDPFTIGHKDIADRALALFDKLIIAIGINREKKGGTDIDIRIDAIKKVYAYNQKVEVVAYDTLTTDLAAKYEANFIVRGVRNIQDFEYERNIADINRHLTGIETILLFADPSLSHISSSMVRELKSFGKDVTPYLP